MKNIILPITEIIVSDIVKESVLKYVNHYKNNKSKYSSKKHEHHQNQKHLNFALEELSKQYIATFTKETERIIHQLKVYEKDNQVNFPGFLRVNYNQLISLINEKELEKPSGFVADKSTTDKEYVSHAVELVRFHFQNEYVIPLINFIDDNYISILIKLKIFPLPVEKLINEIKDNKIHRDD